MTGDTIEVEIGFDIYAWNSNVTNCDGFFVYYLIDHDAVRYCATSNL